jgi:HK97 family phage prohead protease
MTQRPTRRGIEKPLQALSSHGVFAGYASLFGARDQQGDIVMPGAFAASLKRRGAENIRMLFQHNPAEPVGTWLDIHETPKGLYVLGRLNSKVQRGRELLSLLEDGGLDGLSIGFRTVLARSDKTHKVRRLLAVDLWEISLVTFPMLEGARVRQVKSVSLALTDQLFNKSPTATQPTRSDVNNGLPQPA